MVVIIYRTRDRLILDWRNWSAYLWFKRKFWPRRDDFHQKVAGIGYKRWRMRLCLGPLEIIRRKTDE